MVRLIRRRQHRQVSNRVLRSEIVGFAKLRLAAGFDPRNFPALVTIADPAGAAGTDQAVRLAVCSTLGEAIAAIQSAPNRQALQAIFPRPFDADPGNLGERQKRAAEALGYSQSTLRQNGPYDDLIDSLVKSVTTLASARGVELTSDSHPATADDFAQPSLRKLPRWALIILFIAVAGLLVTIGYFWGRQSSPSDPQSIPSAVTSVREPSGPNMSTALIGDRAGKGEELTYAQAAAWLNVDVDILNHECPYRFGEPPRGEEGAPIEVRQQVTEAASEQGQQCAPGPLVALGNVWGQPLGGHLDDAQHRRNRRRARRCR